MRWLIFALYVAVTTGAVVLAIPIFLIAVLFGSAGGGFYLAGAFLLVIAYVAAIVYGRRTFQGIFLRGINQKLADLKSSINFIPVLSVMTSDKLAFLGFDSFSNTAAFINYLENEKKIFMFSDILGCNWKDDDRTALLEITLKEGTVKIGVPSGQFHDFKTRMFAMTGMAD